MKVFITNNIDHPYPNAKCQWCGDTGTFLDEEDNKWPCFEDCPRDKTEEEPA